jgi:hypothetical protein
MLSMIDIWMKNRLVTVIATLYIYNAQKSSQGLTNNVMFRFRIGDTKYNI